MATPAAAARRSSRTRRAAALLATDGVFSMDGDVAPLRELAAAVRAREGAGCMVDDAHGLGVLGARRRGSVARPASMQRDVPVLMGTLGKALGAFGAFVAGSAALIDGLRQFARTYILHHRAAAGAGRGHARGRCASRASRTGGATSSPCWCATSAALRPRAACRCRIRDTPIQPLLVGARRARWRWSSGTGDAGFHVPAVRPPTVAAGSARLRVTLCARTPKPMSRPCSTHSPPRCTPRRPPPRRTPRRAPASPVFPAAPTDRPRACSSTPWATARRWCWCMAGPCTAASSPRCAKHWPRASPCTSSTCPATAAAANATARWTCASAPRASPTRCRARSWLGWSLGGLVALEAALERPLHVRALALVAASPRFVVGPGWPHGVEQAVFDAFGRELARDWRGTLDRFLALECVGSDCARSDLRTLRTHVFERGEPAVHVLDDGLKILADTDLRPHLPELECPSLWIAGARDRLVPWQAMQAAAALAPRGTFARIDGGGHAPFIGHPQRVLHALDEWLARILPA